MDKKNEYFEWVIITSKKYFLVEQSFSLALQNSSLSSPWRDRRTETIENVFLGSICRTNLVCLMKNLLDTEYATRLFQTFDLH